MTKIRSAKVAHLTSVHPPFDVRIFCKECRSLARAGYQVTLIVPHGQDEVVDGVRIKAVPPSKARLSRMTLTVWRVYREALRQNADVYHFHDPEMIPVGLLLRLRGKKVIYDIHEDVPDDILGTDKYYLSPRIRPLLAWLVKRVENFACRRFSALMPATTAIGKRFRALNDNTIVLHNFALLQEFSPEAGMDWRQRNCSVAYVGGISRNRGIWEMVQAMELLPRELNATLKLAGSFSPANIKEEVARLPGWKQVDFLGVLDWAEVAKVLGRVRAGLLILRPEPNHVRAEPMKLFEYMCAGIPVIASDFPLWRKIIQDAGCGLLVDPLAPQAMAQAIQYVLTHPREAEAMGRRGRKAVEQHYNWGTQESKLLDCYASLLNPVDPC